MSFQAQCPNCQRHVTAPDGAEGKRLRCPNCQEFFAVHQHPEGDKAAAIVPAPAAAAAVAPGAAGPHGVWEYHVEDMIEAGASSGRGQKTPEEKQRALTLPIQQRLNELGAEGWELAGSSYCPASSSTLQEQVGYWKLIFKRLRHSS